MLGREVATLVNGELNAGEHSVVFSARGGSAFGGNAKELVSGVYFYELKAGDFRDVKKMLLIK